jgi:Uncharacterized protein conserved in bacteria
MDLLLSALAIFALRIADVSIGTLRIGFLVRGRSALAGIFSFAESLVWLVAAAQVLTSLDNPVKFVAYAGGYAAGTVLGVRIERWVALATWSCASSHRSTALQALPPCARQATS